MCSNVLKRSTIDIYQLLGETNLKMSQQNVNLSLVVINHGLANFLRIQIAVIEILVRVRTTLTFYADYRT